MLPIKSILMIISAVNTRMTLFRLKRKRLRMKIFLYLKSMTVLKMTELIIAFHRNHFQTKQMFFLVILLNLISVLNLIIKLTTFLFQICKLPKLLTRITAYLTLAQIICRIWIKRIKKFMRSQTLNLRRIKLKYQVCHMKHQLKMI